MGMPSLGERVYSTNDSRRSVAAVQSARAVRGVRTILYVDDLDQIDPSTLMDVVAIHFRSKGHSSHVEVICRIKGIPLIQVSKLDFTQDRFINWNSDSHAHPKVNLNAFQGKFQVVIYDSSDLDRINFDRIDTVFVRFEHLMYAAVAKQAGRFNSISDLQEAIQFDLAAISGLLPGNVTLLVRGMDVRSDDRVLGRRFFNSPEPNPELGRHGTRYLQERPDLVAFMAATLHSLPAKARFACPFVTTYREYQTFHNRYQGLFAKSMVPFVESPSIFNEIERYKVDKLCIGLKDVAQFYFAADRANPNVASVVDYTDDGFIGAVARVVSLASHQGIEVHLYQRPDTIAEYVAALSGITWIPSMAASDLAGNI